MQVGLIHVDGKWPNLALMKLSAWHKAQGDTTELYFPMKDYDLVYASKIFQGPDYEYFPENVIKGGSGYNLELDLAPEVEDSFPDYSLYDCSYALGFTSRGCPRRCPWCIVPAKEGKVRPSGEIYNFWNGQPRLILLDNNLTALPDHFELVMKQLIKHDIEVNISQGLDIRLLTQEMADLLARLRLWKRIHFAFDTMSCEEAVRQGMEKLTSAGLHPQKATFYVLIGYNTTEVEDLYRVELLRSLGTNPFVMPYDKNDAYQRRFARWVNRKAIFKSVRWEDYNR